jgi:branched-chain amino acid aminotransferase
MANVVVWKLAPGSSELSEVKITPSPLKLDGASERLPGGAYTTLRTFGGTKVLHLQQHFERLAETARLAQQPVELEGEQIRAGLRKALALYPPVEKRVRITLDLEEQPGDVYIALETLQVPSEQMYQQGVAVVLRRLKRSNPKAKLTGFLAVASEVRHDLPPNVNEALMVDEKGRVLEGLTSNFFAVKGGALWTIEEGVLSGITRSIVLEEAAREGIPIHHRGVRAEELGALEEAFLTSSSRAVLPVVSIDARPVGNGKPGAITRLLLADYNQRIDREVEPV